MHEYVVLCSKEHCHKMARIACCGVAFLYAKVANGILGKLLTVVRCQLSVVKDNVVLND
jgi:hypothetical protein